MVAPSLPISDKTDDIDNALNAASNSSIDGPLSQVTLASNISSELDSPNSNKDGPSSPVALATDFHLCNLSAALPLSPVALASDFVNICSRL